MRNGLVPGPLALIGLSDREAAMTIDRTLLEASGGDEIVYLPSAGVEWAPADLEQSCTYIRSFIEERLGARVTIPMVLSREDACDPDHVETIRRSSYIFIGGGRPGPLAGILRATPVWEAIVQRWQAGAVLAGESAGALVLMDRVPRQGQADGEPFTWEPGLGLLPQLRAVAHLDTAKGQWILAGVLAEAPPDALVVGLPEHSAVIRQSDGTWTALGEGVVVFRDGSPVDLDELSSIRPRDLSSPVAAGS